MNTKQHKLYEIWCTIDGIDFCMAFEDSEETAIEVAKQYKGFTKVSSAWVTDWSGFLNIEA